MSHLRALYALFAVFFLITTPAHALPAEAVQGLPVEVVQGPVIITLVPPSIQLPMQPGVAGLLLLSVEAPDGTNTTLTIQTKGVEDPYQACRPVDAPDEQFVGWLVCEGVGSWALALTIPAQDYAGAPLLCDQLLTIPIKVGVAINNARIGVRIVSAAYRPCWRVALPLVAR